MVSTVEPPRYLRRIQDEYLQLRGGGLTLSPLDADCIDGWRSRGVPLELVLQGIREAHAARQGAGRPARARPFRLRAALPYVDELFAVWCRRAAGVVPAPPDRDGPAPEPVALRAEPVPERGSRVERARRVLQERAASSTGAEAAGYRAAIAPLSGGRSSRLERVLLAADDAQALAYLRALARDEQRRVARDAASGAGERGQVPRRTYRDTLRAYLGEAARRHGKLLRPSDVP